MSKIIKYIFAKPYSVMGRLLSLPIMMLLMVSITHGETNFSKNTCNNNAIRELIKEADKVAAAGDGKPYERFIDISSMAIEFIPPDCKIVEVIIGLASEGFTILDKSDSSQSRLLASIPMLRDKKLILFRPNLELWIEYEIDRVKSVKANIIQMYL